jgi:hypothetical protein
MKGGNGTRGGCEGSSCNFADAEHSSERDEEESGRRCGGGVNNGSRKETGEVA